MSEQEFFESGEWKPTPEEEAEMKAFHEKMLADEKAYYEKLAIVNNRIFRAIKNQLGEEYYEAVKDCLEECEYNGILELTKKPSWKPQYEDWDAFDHIYVDQYIDGGMTGDEFAGYIYIPLKENLYLKSHYNM